MVLLAPAHWVGTVPKYVNTTVLEFFNFYYKWPCFSMCSQTSAKFHGWIDKHATYDNIRPTGFVSRGVSRPQWRLSRLGDAHLHQPRQRAVLVHSNQRRLGD